MRYVVQANNLGKRGLTIPQLFRNRYIIFLTDDYNSITYYPIFSEFEPIADLIKKTETFVEVKLTKNNKTIAYTKKQPLFKSWVMSSWHFWNEDFYSLNLSKKAEYLLEINIETKNPPSENIRIQPILVGGGITLI